MSLSEAARGYLTDILESIARIDRYVAGRDEVSFTADEMCSDAVIRNLEIVGEAARALSKIDPDAADRIEWSEAWAMRNVLTHGYRGVELGIVWDTIVQDLPRLHAAVMKLLDATQ